MDKMLSVNTVINSKQ